MAKFVKHYEYNNNSYSGCDMIATINISNKTYNSSTGKMETKNYNKTIGELQTVSYSIYMDKAPVRSIGNVNAKDYVVGQRTIAGSLVFSVFNKHFSQDIMEAINSDFKAGTAYLVDELPPFDLVISAASEYGYRSRIVIYGIRLLNEGQVMSINDLFIENTYQFFATDIEYLTDELSYTKNTNGIGYTLSDDIEIGTSINYSKVFKNKDLSDYINEQIQKHYDSLRQQKIVLKYGIKEPEKGNPVGLVSFYFNPGVESGGIYIEPESKNAMRYYIALEANKSSNQYNTLNHAEISLPLGKYSAYVETSTGQKSNSVKINIREFGTITPMLLAPPTIDNVTFNSMEVSRNVPEHDKLKLIDADGKITNYNIDSNVLKLQGLKKDSLYSLETYKFNEESENRSKMIQVRTLPASDKLFKELIKYIKANKKKLGLRQDIDECKDIINKFMDVSKSPAFCISKAYDYYLNKLKVLSVYDSNYKKDKEKLEKKIKLCQILYDAALKLTNDNTKAINKENNVPAPYHFLDDNYNNIFQFDKNITSAEIYRLYKNIVQLDSIVYSSDFKTIKNKKNCYRFIGRPGRNYYIKAVNGQVKSSKVYFSVLSTEEKQNKVQHDKNNSYNSGSSSSMTDRDISKIENTVNNELGKMLTELNKKRAFLFNAKKISSPLIFSPSIVSIDTDVILNTEIYNFYSNCEKNMNFYLAISDYDDIVKKNDIYKIPFTNRDEEINVSFLYHGLKDNTAYACWIESEDEEQISNPVTFIYSTKLKVNYENDEINAYELKDIIKTLTLYAKNDLTPEIKDSIVDSIDSASNADSLSIMPSIFKILSESVITKKDLLNYIYDIKYFITLFTNAYTSLIYNVEYGNNKLSFNSKFKGSVVIYSGDGIYNLNLENNNSINLSSYDSNILIINIIDDTLYNKSDIIIINQKEKYMEVL